MPSTTLSQHQQPLQLRQRRPALCCGVQQQKQQRVLRRRRAVSVACAASGQSEQEQQLSVTIPTAEARATIRFNSVATGPAQQAIVVSAVAEGCSAAEAGVARGCRLTHISDPVRASEVWQLQDRPSLRYVREALRMRRSATINLGFAPPTPELLDALDAAEGSLALTPSSCSSSSSSSSSSLQEDTAAGAAISSIDSLISPSDDESDSLGQQQQQQRQASSTTMADRLAARFAEKESAGQAATAFNQRQERRQQYMAQVGQRKDNTFGLLLLAAFVLPAALVLAAAWGTGYLDRLYSLSTTSYMR